MNKNKLPFGENTQRQNFLISGENKEVLKLMQKDPEINKKVKLIYIDPPFATGQDFYNGKTRTQTISRSSKDSLSYSDTLIGNDYLDFMEERLLLLREIMSEDGSIYVHIDTKIGHYLKIVMDKVFGQKNFINDIARIKSNHKNFRRKAYSNIRDMLLFYAKNKGKHIWNEQYEKMTEEEIKKIYPKIDSHGRRYMTTPIHAPGETKQGKTGQPWNGKKPPEGRHWRYKPEVLDDLDSKGQIEWSKNGNPRLKRYAKEAIERGKKRGDVWLGFKDPQYPKYPTEKNLDMIKTIIAASSNQGDLVLDAFCGSGTTCIASEQLGRNWVGIDSSDQAIRITEKRLLTVVNNVKILDANKYAEKLSNHSHQ